MRLRVSNFLTWITLGTVLAASAALVLGQAPAGGRGAAPAAPAAQGGRGAGAPAQGRGAAAAGPALPRTADGHPDFSGIWQVLDDSANGDIEPHAASWGVRAGQGIIVDPADPWPLLAYPELMAINFINSSATSSLLRPPPALPFASGASPALLLGGSSSAIAIRPPCVKTLGYCIF